MQSCRTCHARNGSLFDGSKHKEVFIAHGWPECQTCHGKHAIAKASEAMLGAGVGGVCTDCHARFATGNPVCEATATHIRDTLTRLVSGHQAMTRTAETFARHGLDTEPMHEQLTALWDAVQESRSYVHAFDRGAFDQVAKPGIESLSTLGALTDAAEGEQRYRRLGLLLAVALIGLLMLLLRLKLRQIERRPDA
jgi:predicted CXXCH cytochrome family protein